MSTTDPVKRVYPRYRSRLEADVLAFTRAYTAFGQAETTSGVTAGPTPDMIAALDQWRSDVNAATVALNAAAARSNNKALALETMQALATALASFADSLQLADPAKRAAAGEQAQAQFAAYHSLSDELDRRVP